MDKTDASVLPAANKLLYLDQNGELNTNAATATKLKNPINLAISGDASGSVQFDGKEDVSLNVSIPELTINEVEQIFRSNN